MKNDNIILLALVGLGIYLYIKNKPKIVNTNNVAPDTSGQKPQSVEADYNINFSINGMKKLGNVPNII
jgi:hypothetical protein